jgi:sterol desaturase/sphingolipid hydroxylase (fatty acid hydroxylase superfamily)
MSIMDLLAKLPHGVLRDTEVILILTSICIIFEVAMPEDSPSLASRVRGATFRFIYIIVGELFGVCVHLLTSALNIHPLLSVSLGDVADATNPVRLVTTYILVLVGSVWLGDFFYYWWHRSQHAFPVLWRFHQVHHAIREMSAWNCNHHLAEEIMRYPFVGFPMAILIGFDHGIAPALLGVGLVFVGLFQHCNTRFHLGPFRWIVADNRFHRIHHSLEKAHWDRNFGGAVTLWDMMFRTAYFPKFNEWPAVGLDYVDEARRLSNYLLLPFTTSAPSLDEQPVELDVK